MRRRPPAAPLLVAAAALLPRLAVVLYERGDLLGGRLVEKSDRFARTLAESGTFGFLPGRPSAYTQPLYGWFLAGLYWALERSWLVVGLAQAAVATGTALLVYALGSRVLSRREATVAGLVVALHPYLVWHDVHVNRELLDGTLAALTTLLVVLAARRGALILAGAAGLAAGVAILGNARLALLPLVFAGWLAVVHGGRTGLVRAAVLVAAAAVAVTPWVVRNRVEVGCAAITTDARALWKANNPATYGVLASGGWIDEVPELPGAPPWPELAADRTLAGRPTSVDECAQMRLYRSEVVDFWRDEPGEKARLSAQAVGMLWSPVFTVESDRDDTGLSGFTRVWVVPAYVVALYAAALLGLPLLPRAYAALTLLVLAYQTLAAVVFAGTMRYRVPWDFLLAVPAGAALVRASELVARRRAEAGA